MFNTNTGDDAINVVGPTAVLLAVWRNLHLSAHLIQMQMWQSREMREMMLIKMLQTNENETHDYISQV